MNWRSAGIIIGILAVFCIALVFSFLYPFSTSTPPHLAPSEQQFSFEEADEYRVTGSITIDDQTRYDVDGVVTADDERYAVIESRVSTAELYQPGPGGDRYTRVTFEDETEADRLIDSIEDDTDRKPLEITEGDEVVVEYLLEDAGRTPNSLENEARYVIGNFVHIPYAETDEAGDNTTYEPQDAWIAQGDRRVADTTGSVDVDTETRAVKSANVSWEQTRLQRLTYLNYLLTTIVADESSTWEVTYEFETGGVDVETPDWVKDAQNE